MAVDPSDIISPVASSSNQISTFSENNLQEIIQNVENENDSVPLRAVLVKDSFEFLENLKKIFNSDSCTRTQKLQVITLVPDSWSDAKIMTHFDTNRRLIRMAKELKQENGILATPASKKGSFCQISIHEIFLLVKY